MTQQVNSILKDLNELGIPYRKERFVIKLNNAREIFTQYMQLFLSIEQRKLEWQPEYEEVVNWLSDNKGRGLFLYGDCGRGKSIIAQQVIPSILLKYCGKVVSVFNIQQMSTKLDEILKHEIISIDDLGTEPPVVNNFGTKRYAFPEIIDVVEKNSKFVLLTSNLRAAQLTAFYDERTLERIISTTKRIEFKGKSLRQ